MPSWFLPLLVVLWVFNSLVSSLVTGWMSLVRRFRATMAPDGEKRTSSYLVDQVVWRLASRDPFVHLTAANDALYLRQFVLFRLFHPPLRIPWSEIEFEHTMFGDEVRLTLGNEEKIPLTVRASLAQKLRLPLGEWKQTESGFDTLSADFIESMNKKFKYK